MELLQYLHVHTGLIIEAFHVTPGHDFHQVGVALVVLGQQHQMIIAVVAAGGLLVEPGVGSYVDLAAQDGLDPLRPGRPIEVDDAEHGSVVGNSCGSHAQLLHLGHVFFYFIGAVQKAVFCMGV